MDNKCQERINHYKEKPEHLRRSHPDFDGSTDAWFAAGWDCKTNSLVGARMSLINMVKNSLPRDGSIKFEVFTKISKAIQDMGGAAIDLSDIIPVYLERYKPIRIVMRDSDDGLEGLIENSFSMDFDKKRVRIFWSGKAYSILGEQIINGIDHANHNAKKKDYIFDPLDPLCPVQIDWTAWLSATDKFDFRNAPFTVRTFESEEEDAVLQ